MKKKTQTQLAGTNLQESTLQKGDPLEELGGSNPYSHFVSFQ